MAEQQENRFEISLHSTETAVCIVPPRHLWESIDRLRALYDKAYEKWPPHINLIYPFVAKEELTQASTALLAGVKAWSGQTGGGALNVRLDSASVFLHKHSNTLYRHDGSKERSSCLAALRRSLLKSLGQNETSFTSHLTVGQSEDAGTAAHKFLLSKIRMLPPIEWEVEDLYILVRERTREGNVASSQMKLWGVLNLKTKSLSRAETPKSFYELSETPQAPGSEASGATEDEPPSWTTYQFSESSGRWSPRVDFTDMVATSNPDFIKVSSYNVLADFNYPPSLERYPATADTILSEAGAADILVLQEVSDEFLANLLADGRIQKSFKYASHGPGNQLEVEPLPSLLNIVVLSKWEFSWKWVSSKRRHKGSAWDDTIFLPLVIAGVHLTCGLTDGAVAAKKTELAHLLKYLDKNCSENPCVLAGDFNITTSSSTIEHALRKNNISQQTADYLGAMDRMLSEARFLDAWTTTRIKSWAGIDSEGMHDVDSIVEGEQGATFNPLVNKLAEDAVGTGTNNRPQRYDRILVKNEGFFDIVGFNMFGLLPVTTKARQSVSNDSEDSDHPHYDSDHWGVRCSLKLSGGGEEEAILDSNSAIVPVQLVRAATNLASHSDLKDCLAKLGAFSTAEDAARREQALAVIRSVFVEPSVEDPSGASVAHPRVSFVVTPVGSYGLGVWTSSSDIDCLCIGPLTPRTFFALARIKLKKAAKHGIKILRLVKAHSGTMLELEVLGIKVDLQYCPSAYIAERWPEAMGLSLSDPTFSLSPQTLLKLKPARDLFYLRRSIPDLASFRIAYHAIKLWAKSQGIYSAKFGYLGGIHISILLTVVCKQLAHDAGAVSTPDILASFFDYYASFDWKNRMVYDPFFHKGRLRYSRTAREPIAILGYHPPALNVAHAASAPSVRTIAEAFRNATTLFSNQEATWSMLLAGSDGVRDFLRAYKSYVKIDLQFWGVSLAKGTRYVGWLESRCVMLLVDISRRLPGLFLRIWPARFVENAASDEDRDYQGSYLIGLDILDKGEMKMGKEDLKLASGALQTVLHKFETQIRGDERYFDCKSSWMSASVVNQGELGDLKLDTREWGQYAFGEEDSDEEGEDDDSVDEGVEEEKESDAALSSEGGATVSKRKGMVPNAGRAALPRPAGSGGKLRTAVDVLNRLRWDPILDSGDYLVGYEDRFVGAREKALDTWKSEQTDEEFIPQHRILYFKRRSDGAIVWERRTRKDEIFGKSQSQP